MHRVRPHRGGPSAQLVLRHPGQRAHAPQDLRRDLGLDAAEIRFDGPAGNVLPGEEGQRQADAP